MAERTPLIFQEFVQPKHGCYSSRASAATSQGLTWVLTVQVSWVRTLVAVVAKRSTTGRLGTTLKTLSRTRSFSKRPKVALTDINATS